VKIMLSCGEPSGDLYAGALAAELRQRNPSIDIFGFGGEQLRRAGARLVGDFAGLSVTGLTEAIRVLPRSFAMLHRLVAAAAETRPDVFVAIDFPDFNFRLMASLHRLGIPVVYYISPQLWAWRPGRMQTMKRLVDRVLVIFPFEEAIYRREGVDASFVGHPLVDLARASEGREPFLRAQGLDASAPVVALLPGSRSNEVQRILPGIAAAIPLIAARVPRVQFIVAAAPNLDAELFAPLERVRSASIALVSGRADDVLAASDAVITASGTATVQAALHERPMVVVYRLSELTYRIGKPFVKVDTYAMVNLVAGTRLVPELIQQDFTPQRVADETVRYFTDSGRYQQVREGLREVRRKLGAPGASGRAADAILEVAARAGARSA
jgi:lipid-A-disaccharide synthase